MLCHLANAKSYTFMMLDLVDLFFSFLVFFPLSLHRVPGKALAVCEDKCNENTEHSGEMETEISWYNGVLGFRIECGHGLYFSHLWSINIFL